MSSIVCDKRGLTDRYRGRLFIASGENAMPLQRLTKELEKKGMLPFLVQDLTNIRYLTGFTGSSAAMVLLKNDAFFISDSRYMEYAQSLLPKSVTFLLVEETLNDTLKTVMKETGLRELYFEDESLTFGQHHRLNKKLRGVTMYAAGDPVREMRMIKEDDEIALLRAAAKVTDRCISHIRGMVKPGMKEWDVAVEIEHFYRTHGCRKSSFEAIVASGAGSSMPHYETSLKKKIRKGDTLLIDTGCLKDGYNSDLTRTFFIGSVDARLKEIYSIVRVAQEEARKALRPGITTGQLDAVARDIITDAGYGEYFGHSLGHGLGMEVHEMPAVRSGELKLKKNMVITIEPGIYLPGIGGVRIEDMMVVTAKGGESLTTSGRQLSIL